MQREKVYRKVPHSRYALSRTMPKGCRETRKLSASRANPDYTQSVPLLLDKTRDAATRIENERFTAGSLGTDLWAYSMFIRQVEDSLQGQHLPYSQRNKLIKRAATLGIDRFDANLIIATVQHRAKPMFAEKMVPPKPNFPIATISAFAILQTAIIIAAWWVVS